jgi:hypothetical protein
VTARSGLRPTAWWGLLGALLLFLGPGCGRPREAARSQPPAVFPHPDGYEQSHATLAEGGSAPCGDCHGLRPDDAVGGAVPAAPACRSCHDTYPHPPSFEAGSVHAAALAADPEQCVGCHGADGARAAAGAERGRCTGCHSTYPHPEPWAEADGHGTAARTRGVPGCLGCHGADGAAIAEATCTECHAAPHPAGYAAPSVHGAAAAEDPEACASCHAEDPDAPGRRTCASCHDLYPHPPDWGTTHLAAVDSRGRLACAGCHDGGMSGPALPATCGHGCHDGGLP